MPQIATELSVDAVLESTVMCLGDSICLQVKLISAFPEEKQLWIGNFKEEKGNILNLYNRIKKQIADEVKIKLTSQEKKQLNTDKHLMQQTGQLNTPKKPLRSIHQWRKRMRFLLPGLFIRTGTLLQQNEI